MQLYKHRIKKILKLRDEHPDWTLMQIAEVVGVVISRVHLVLSRAGKKTNGIKKSKKKECLAKCGTFVYNPQLLCGKKECHDKFFKKEVLCSYCRAPKIYEYSDFKKLVNRGQVRFYCGHECFRRGLRDRIS